MWVRLSKTYSTSHSHFILYTSIQENILELQYYSHNVLCPITLPIIQSKLIRKLLCMWLLLALTTIFLEALHFQIEYTMMMMMLTYHLARYFSANKFCILLYMPLSLSAYKDRIELDYATSYVENISNDKAGQHFLWPRPTKVMQISSTLD